MIDSSRSVAWFSCGAASAVACKLAQPDVIAYIDTGSEHADNPRFLADCQEWFGQEIVILKSSRYGSVDEVIEGERFIASRYGAPCTGILKREVRYQFQRPGDRQVFGYVAEEAARAERFALGNPEVSLILPLVDRHLSKSDCLSMVERAGIRLPAMYEMGYRNNNCIGCVKGGMGYWNKIRRDFPDVFARRAAQERDIGASILTDGSTPLYLDELEPGRGNYAAESVSCSLMCAGTEIEIDIASRKAMP